MPRHALAITMAMVSAALLGLLTLAASQSRSQAFTLGVANNGFVEVAPGQEACQGPIAVPEHAGFEGVTVSLGTNGRPGPPVDVSVRDRGRVLARATLPGGYSDVDVEPAHTVWLHPVPAGRVVFTCLANAGDVPLYVFGDGESASRSTRGELDGTPIPTDLNLAFERREPRSLLSLVPAMIERAALFRGSWVGPWTYVLLALLVLVAVPALMLRAMAAATREAP